ncbi:Peptidase C11, clostripain [Candidatus Magnetomorum sp. HK-1]|nr:Peptidase C11, clostripain [Candidatus Magnetomorum sp. HK-1]
MKKSYLSITLVFFSLSFFFINFVWAQTELPKEGWEPVFTESFDRVISDHWILRSNNNKLNWTTTNSKFDKTNPNSNNAAKAMPNPPPDAPIGGYPPNIKNWMISKNPIDLQNKTGAEILFSFIPFFGDGARLGLCIGISSDSESLTQCQWYDHPSEMWQFAKFDLQNFMNIPGPIYMGWVFESGTGDPEKPGVFVDEIQVWATEYPIPQPPDYNWQPVFKESFGSVDISTDPRWTLVSNQQEINWSTTDLKFDSTDPNEAKSAAAIPAPHQGYPAGLENWMIFGPLDLKEKKTIEVFFSYYLDGNETDWLGFVVGKGNTKEDFIPENILWLNNSGGHWRNEYKELNLLAGQEGVFIAWIFRSEAGSLDKKGVFVDRIEVLATEQVAPPMFEHSDDFVQWDKLFTESFDSEDLYADAAWTAITEKGNIVWQTTVKKSDPVNPDSLKSAAVTSTENGYPKDIKTWMIYGPVDLSNVAQADAKFSILFDLEENDRLGFFAAPGASPSEIPQKLKEIPNLKWWTGSSENRWDIIHGDLSPIAGQSNVYLAWYFESTRGSNSKQGIFMDELEILGQNKEAEIPEIAFDNNGVRLENGDFARNSLNNWTLKDHGPGNGAVKMREKNGDYFPEISGNQIFYQPVNISSEINDLFISFSYAVTTTETERDQDEFCVTLTSEDDTDNIIVDLGCWDVVDFPDYAKTEDSGLIWDNYEKSLDDDEIEKIIATGESQIAFVIQFTQDESETGNSTLFLDNVNVYATGYARRSTDDTTQVFASQRDPGEPNDSFNRATSLECGETFSGVFGDMGGGFDKDYYLLSKVPIGEVEIDIDARTKQPPSAADSKLEIHDSDFVLISKNDDDGISLDPKVIFENFVEDASYYIAVKNNHGGGPYFYYDLTVSCRETSEKRRTLYNPTTSKEQSRKVSRSTSTLPGDINGDNDVTLLDVIFGLQITADYTVSPILNADVDGDSAIGLKDTLFALEVSAGLREIEENEDSKETWTMILYLNAEDQSCVNLGVEATCWNNIYEKSIQQIEAYIDEKKEFLTVIALIDGPNFDGVESDVTRYVVQPNGNYTENENFWNLDEINMGDPDDFSDYIEWGMTNYPADNYYVAVHDHGHGIFGMSWDHNDKDGSIDDYLTAPELRSALKEISNNGENKIDIFEFQACLMGLLENAYDIREYVNYVSFFQPISWSSYNYPEYFKELEQGDDPLTVGKRIIQNYPVSGDSFPYAFSLIDADKLESLREKLDDFVDVLMTASSSEIKAARDESQAFNGNVNKGDPQQDVIGYIDLWYLADRVSAKGIAVNEVALLKTAIEEAVVHSKATLVGGDPLWDYSNFHGLSVLYPMGNYSFIADYEQNYQMSEDGKWDDFLTDKAFADTKRSGDNDRVMNIPEILEESVWVSE